MPGSRRSRRPGRILLGRRRTAKVFERVKECGEKNNLVELFCQLVALCSSSPWCIRMWVSGTCLLVLEAACCMYRGGHLVWHWGSAYFLLEVPFAIYSLPGCTAAVVWPISLWNSQENLWQNLVSDLVPPSVFEQTVRSAKWTNLKWLGYNFPM